MQGSLWYTEKEILRQVSIVHAKTSFLYILILLTVVASDEAYTHCPHHPLRHFLYLSGTGSNEKGVSIEMYNHFCSAICH